MNSDKPFVNYFAQALSDDRAIVMVEVFDGGKLVDVETMSVYRSTLPDCEQKAIAENKAAVERGDHVSQYRAANQKAAA